MPRVLLLHGFTGAPRSFDQFVRELGSSWQCLRPSLPGHGPEAGVLAPRSFAEGVANFAATLRPWLHETAEKTHLFGYSLGARVALGLLDQEPAEFASATLVSVHFGLRTSDARTQRRLVDKRWQALLATEGLDAFCREWEAQPLFSTQQSLPAELIEEQTRVRRSHTSEGLAWSLETFGLAEMPFVGGQLRSSQVPIHLIVGERDAKFRAHAQAFINTSHRCRLSILDRGGHNLVLEQPRALARAFIEGVGSE